MAVWRNPNHAPRKYQYIAIAFRASRSTNQQPGGPSGRSHGVGWYLDLSHASQNPVVRVIGATEHGIGSFAPCFLCVDYLKPLEHFGGGIVDQLRRILQIGINDNGASTPETVRVGDCCLMTEITSRNAMP